MKAATRPAVGARDRLIEAGGEVFGERGFEGATVREITRMAKVNLAAINYYFRDKEELYWEVLQHAAKSCLRLDQAVDHDADPQEQLRAFVADLLRSLLDPNRPAWHGKLLAREMGAPTRLLDVLVESHVRPKRNLLRKILRQLAGSDLTEEEEALLCGSIMGQCLYYRQNGPVSERLFPGLLTRKDAIARLARHITTFSLAAIESLYASRKLSL